MKKIQIFFAGILVLLSCITLVTVQGDSLSTTVRYTVNPTVIYVDYDGTQTTQKVEPGKTLKEPGHKGKKGYTFIGWKNVATGEFWDFSNTVEDHLTLVACYSQNKTDGAGKVQLGSGTFSIDIRIENGVSDVGVAKDKVKLMDMLIDDGSITVDEISKIANGASMDIVLVVKDGTSTISASSKAQIEGSAGEYTVAQYLDITLFKYLTVNGKTGKGQEISQTSGMITVSVKLKDNLINTDRNVERSYIVIRNHEGTVEILNATYDENTHTITFQTNQFSDYAIAYKDTVRTGVNGNTQNQNNNRKQSSATTKNTGIKNVSSPPTGDDSKPDGYGLTLLGSAISVLITAFTLKKKKRNKI